MSSALQSRHQLEKDLVLIDFGLLSNIAGTNINKTFIHSFNVLLYNVYIEFASLTAHRTYVTQTWGRGYMA